MAINIYNINYKRKIKNRKLLKRWIKSVISEYKRNLGYINIILTDDNYLLKLNIKYLNKNNLTDIITFNYNDGEQINGDLFISVERISENSILYSNTFSEELLRVIIHGILHLIGFSDQTDEEQFAMRNKEDSALIKVKGLNLI